MRTLSRATLLLLTLVSVQAALAEGPTWRDSTRDVYVNGHLDRAARVLSADAGKKTAVLLPGARKALLLDRETSIFSVVPRKAFAIAGDGAGAELAAEATPKPAGAFQRVDSSRRPPARAVPRGFAAGTGGAVGRRVTGAPPPTTAATSTWPLSTRKTASFSRSPNGRSPMGSVI